MKKKLAILLLLVALAPFQSAYGQFDMESVQHQLQLCDEVMEYLDEVFQSFSEGYLMADDALKKINLLIHKYNMMSEPLPPEAKDLNTLMKQLLSRIEYYFIHFKKSNRENPEINLQIAKTRFEIAQEMARLKFLYTR